MAYLQDRNFFDNRLGFKDEINWLDDQDYGVIRSTNMPSCEPGRFKRGKLDVVWWGKRVTPGKRRIPKHLKLAILSRGRIRLPIKNIKWIIDKQKKKVDWVCRIPDNLGELLPEVDVTIELFTVRKTLSFKEVNSIFLQYLVQRHNQELRNCHKLFLLNWRSAFLKSKVETQLKVKLDELFKRAKVPFPEGMSEADKRIFVLLVYVSFPDKLELYLKDKKTEDKELNDLLLQAKHKTTHKTLLCLIKKLLNPKTDDYYLPLKGLHGYMNEPLKHETLDNYDRYMLPIRVLLKRNIRSLKRENRLTIKSFIFMIERKMNDLTDGIRALKYLDCYDKRTIIIRKFIFDESKHSNSLYSCPAFKDQIKQVKSKTGLYGCIG
ncbi:hypothetical protein [Acaryochloris sp. IP29b_bin.137]|uniref:hypothetical protein n=1 Tax=Acaryochloris sp. IP29b_bin.137 TaxID=2969217 RepID=UPI0026228114|nr:hypothetical protein [Acaryochloris sp. IP29b_bin.137]